ncbi:MAG TPA: cytochrome c-type biogenesis CcmF C-terminal domain-containing protein [Gemmataceae bacterium]|nr:cytochrome c-type biogenesis CcmF C-terminal domain-containing protein [Gemmataceae bacterium]
MRNIGELCLLMALVCSGYGAFTGIASRVWVHPWMKRAGFLCGIMAVACLSGAIVILGRALLIRDFDYEYVANYSSTLLSWQYALSALWVGQAGSLLLWAWLLSLVTLLFRILPTRDKLLRDAAFGILLANVLFLISILIFAADPFKPTLGTPKEGLGLSPLLQHPSMLIHPPVTFLAYALWSVPFALAMGGLIHKRLDPVTPNPGSTSMLPMAAATGNMSEPQGEPGWGGGGTATWTEIARPWAIAAWAVLGSGLLLGADWAYEVLGWGGYWGWDPVENGSFLPWLTGTALIHALMAWRHRQCLKKTAVALAILTCALCNFATFLTRSGIFSSVHAFSTSPIGWMFLGFMAVLLLGGLTLIVRRREALRPERVARNLLAREHLVLLSTILILAFALVILAGTLVNPLSPLVLGRSIVVGAALYTNVFIPVGLALLAVTAIVPLTRWGGPPLPRQRRVLWISLGTGCAVATAGFLLTQQHAIASGVTGLLTLVGFSTVAALILDARRREPDCLRRGILKALYHGRRQYAGYVIHLGLAFLAIGIAGSALGTRRSDVVMSRGEVISWAGRQIRLVSLEQHLLPDKAIAEAVLEVTQGRGTPAIVRPARHLHRLQNEWTTAVAIHSTWSGDFYTILNGRLGGGKVDLTLVENPMMRWIWLGGACAVLGAVIGIWPGETRRSAAGLLADEECDASALDLRGDRQRHAA